MLVLIVYLVGLIDPLTGVIGLSCLGLFFNVVGNLLYMFPEESTVRSSPKTKEEILDDRRPGVTSRIRKSVTTTVCLALLVVFLPSTSTAYKMLAAYGVTEVVQSDAAARLAPKSLQFLELTLDKQLTELKTQVVTEVN